MSDLTNPVFSELDMRWIAYHMRGLNETDLEVNDRGATRYMLPLEREAFRAVVLDMASQVADSLGEHFVMSPADYLLEDCPATVSRLREFGLECKEATYA